MSGKGSMTYNKALTKEKLREWGSLSREGVKIKFVDIRFKRWQIVGFVMLYLFEDLEQSLPLKCGSKDLL